MTQGHVCAESMEEMELVFQILSFWLEHSPGNASVGSTVMQVQSLLAFYCCEVIFYLLFHLQDIYSFFLSECVHDG